MSKTKRKQQIPRRQKRKTNNFLIRIERYFSENEKLLSKYSLLGRLFINFPSRKSVPLLSKIAMWILRIQGGILDITFNDLKKIENDIQI